MEVVHALLDAKVEIAANKTGINVFSQSLSDGRQNVVDAILSTKVDFSEVVHGRDSRGRSVFFHYVEKGNLDMLTKLGQYYNKRQ